MHASLHSDFDVGFSGDGLPMSVTSDKVESDLFLSCSSVVQCNDGSSLLDASISETNPFLQSPSENTVENQRSNPASGIDAYFGNAADNWLGSCVDNCWLADNEQQARESPSTSFMVPPPPPPMHPVELVSPVAKPAPHALQSLGVAPNYAAQPRFQQPPPLHPSKPDGFVSPSKFFPPTSLPSMVAPFSPPKFSQDDPVLKKNYPEGRCSGATWAWGGLFFTFSTVNGFTKTHSVSLHSCGKRVAFQPSVARIKAWPGCDASTDVMIKFLNNLKSFKIDDQAIELVSPYQDSFEALTSLLSMLLSRGRDASSEQHMKDVMQVFDDSNSFSDSMNLVRDIDAFRSSDPTRDLLRVQQHLLEGKCDEAIDYAMQSDLWAEALVLSQVASQVTLMRTVTQRLTERCLIAGTPLWFLHALNSGIVPEGPKLHSHWRLCAKILLQNRFSNTSQGLRALARAVLTHGDSCAWMALNATAAAFSKEKQQHVAAANFSTPPAADIAELRNVINGIASIRALKARESSSLTDPEKKLLATERDLSAKFEELKARAPGKEPHQGSLFYGYSSVPLPALMHPTTCERAEMFAAAFAGKAKGHMVRGLLYWRFMHAMWMVRSINPVLNPVY
jgi:hypothetical protein